MSAVFCMAFHEKALNAQLSQHDLSFSTKAQSVETGTGTPQRKVIRTFKSPVKVSSQAGPSTPTPITAFFPPVLDFNADVPIYDARGKTVDYQKDLPALAKKLPPFTDGEVPVDSFAVVGYSATTYVSGGDGKVQLSLNVLFVIVVGTP
ncbi:hypothetical protein DXG01_015773 [Tephrocybe rancida]|nr:hypothetical protein DXG01_015773 [Tephrocybe rancida]